MKLVVLLLVVAAGVWYGLVGGRKLKEADVRAHLDASARATIARDGETLCRQLSRDLVMIDRTIAPGQSIEQTFNRDQACEHLKAGFAAFDALAASGARLPIRYDFQIDSVTVAPGRERAVVEGQSTMTLGDGVMRVISTGTSEYVSELGQIRLVRSETQTRIRGLTGTMSQSEFFKQ